MRDLSISIESSLNIRVSVNLAFHTPLTGRLLVVQGNCTTKYSHNFYSSGTTFIHVLVSLFKISEHNSTPPPFRGPLNKIDNRYDTFFHFEGGPPSVRGSHTPNLVQIFKGLVTLYVVSPFQFTIRHTTAPCRIQPVSNQTW